MNNIFGYFDSGFDSYSDNFFKESNVFRYENSHAISGKSKKEILQKAKQRIINFIKAGVALAFLGTGFPGSAKAVDEVNLSQINSQSVYRMESSGVVHNGTNLKIDGDSSKYLLYDLSFKGTANSSDLNSYNISKTGVPGAPSLSGFEMNLDSGLIPVGQYEYKKIISDGNSLCDEVTAALERHELDYFAFPESDDGVWIQAGDPSKSLTIHFASDRAVVGRASFFEQNNSIRLFKIDRDSLNNFHGFLDSYLERLG